MKKKKNTITTSVATLMRALAGVALSASFLAPAIVHAELTVSRLTPPSLLFSNGLSGSDIPQVSRFLAGQRFDLQATVQPAVGFSITKATFAVDGVVVGSTDATLAPGGAANVSLIPCTVSGLATGSVSPTLRAYQNTKAGVHTLTVTAEQDNGVSITATGSFEVISISSKGRVAKNVIFMIGDGMGIAHRSAARIMYRGVLSGKSLAPLEMDAMDSVALVRTASLNSIITDSAPGAACYSTGNKGNNNQQGVFPDDTTDAFDNPRIELIGEFLARTRQKSLGIVTTADIFDATPGAFGSHTQNRSAGTGICDGYLDEQVTKSNLSVLLGGGRKWFLSSEANGSGRTAGTGGIISAELATGWGIPTRSNVDTARDLIGGFQSAGFTYAPTKTGLDAAFASGVPDKLLGLFALSNMSVAKDKIDGRRGNDTVVTSHGFTDQPLLEEMTDAALKVLSKNSKGFVLMVEAASIDKQAHNMDTERWITDTIEFDKAIGVAKRFAEQNPDTLIIVTADHECAGVNIIGASTETNAGLAARALNGTSSVSTVGTYENARFPWYEMNESDGYPQTTDIDNRMLIGYAANCDRYEDWLTNASPDTTPTSRDTAGGLLITGQVPGSSAVHTGSDIPLTASGRASSLFKGVVDNTDVFFLALQAALGGATN